MEDKKITDSMMITLDEYNALIAANATCRAKLEVIRSLAEKEEGDCNMVDKSIIRKVLES